MSNPPDPALILAAQQGDAQAVAALFSHYWRPARAMAYGVTGDWASAEDAASEALLQAIAAIGSLEDPARFPAWLRTIVVRKARAEIARRPAVTDAADQYPDPAANPALTFERAQLAAQLQHAFRQLPATLRETLALHYYEGYSPAHAARLLNIPAGTFRRRLYDGRRLLRAAIEKPQKGTHTVSIEQQLAAGNFHEAIRLALAERPPSPQLAALLRKHLPTGPPPIAEITRLLAPAPPNATAQTLRQALPEFQEWHLDIPQAAADFFASGKAPEPPGPGAWLRPSRALLRLTDDGTLQSVVELIHDSPSVETLQSARHQLHFADVLDLTWPAPDLHAVHLRIAQLANELLPEAQPQFSAYNNAPYRAAWQLQFEGIHQRVAIGGIFPNGAAHVRLFLAPWAAALSGTPI